MRRLAVLGLTLTLIVVPSMCLGQTTDQTDSGLPFPTFSAQAVSGEAVVDLADFVAEHLSATGAVPDMAQVVTSDGEARTLSASQLFALLARTAHLWRFTGELPDTVPLTADEITAPVLDAEDIIASPQDQDLGREVDTESFLSQVSAVVRWLDQLLVVPTAVWVDGQRLSAADYLAGLAICVSYAYWEGELYETLFLPPYAPPATWIGDQEAEHYVAAEEGETWTEEGSGSEDYLEEEWIEQPAASETRRPLTSMQQPLPGSQAEPELVVYPEPGERISGYVDLVASYSGPPARFVIFSLDARHDVIRNYPPYSYRWDTRMLEPGFHTVRVQVIDAQDGVLADQTTAYEVVATGPESETEIPSDL
ncbi:MAG: hypothetical protein JXB46_02340 [Candidatus Eisenbacteria bacterium]|nr:hypothetical protein [Candidatus Eisenbacteria bacterium]